MLACHSAPACHYLGYIDKLERDGELSNKVQVKPVAKKNDLDILIAVLFLDAFALTLHGIQSVLNLALVLCAPQGSSMPSLSPRHPLQRPQPPRKIRLIWPSTPLVCWPPLLRSCSPFSVTSLAPRKRNGRSPPGADKGGFRPQRTSGGPRPEGEGLDSPPEEHRRRPGASGD